MPRNLLIICILVLVTVSCKSPEARRPVKSSSGSFITESVDRNKKIYEQERAEIAAIIKENEDRSYIASKSGFWYYYVVKDSTVGQVPRLGDTVTFKYDIKKLNGTIIVSKEENGIQNYIIDRTNQELISGIRDGLKIMKVGETITFLFPSYKAFGYYGIENKLGTNVPIQSTVTLETIQSQEN
ncbi:MAG: gliding motility-associated peptidyl-prolyl isomerase GldI [Flavobacteriaceae bacterium]|nr:gliding motility-associated peptidyl-prolyl isomerase GldI [Flavobacteriaceae bacterium]